jgi:hypothetical protein
LIVFFVLLLFAMRKASQRNAHKNLPPFLAPMLSAATQALLVSVRWDFGYTELRPLQNCHATFFVTVRGTPKLACCSRQAAPFCSLNCLITPSNDCPQTKQVLHSDLCLSKFVRHGHPESDSVQNARREFRNPLPRVG